MKKRRKLNLKKVNIAKIDYPNRIIGKGENKEPYSTPGANCKSPSDTSPAGNGRLESVILPCDQGQTGNECH